MITERDRFRPHPRVIDTVLDEDEATLTHVDTKLSYALNRTGLRIWMFLKQGATIAEVADKIHEEFDVERERARRDAANLAARLLALDLIAPVQR